MRKVPAAPWGVPSGALPAGAIDFVDDHSSGVRKGLMGNPRRRRRANLNVSFKLAAFMRPNAACRFTAPPPWHRTHRAPTSFGCRLVAGCTGAILAGAAVIPVSILLSIAAPPASAAQLSQPMVPGHGQAYLGAFVDPSGGIPRTQYELEALPPFNQELARHLSIVRIAQPWTKPTTDDQLNDVLAQGGIPLIDWACGVPDRAIVAGTYDNAITAFAGQLAAWGAPMFLSWFPDPNVSGGNTAQCLGPAGAHGYQRAFQHIRHLFVAAGARNVAFVWSVAAQGGDPDWSSYYPGANSVNWIAASGNIQGKTIRPNTFANYFNLWYSTFSAYGKPLMIGQTATSGPNQAPYLQQVATDLPAQFPLIKAFVYWDAPGAVAFQLGPAGLPAFEALSSDTYFQPKRHASSVTITVAPNPAATGQDVHFTTSIASSDQGGTISYYANGTLIAGCTAIPIEFTTACDTDSLPAGHDTVRAVYGGDAEFAGSRSPPITVVVAPAPPPAGTKTPMVPSAGHAYLGGWINPIPLQDEPPGTTHMEAELKALPGFDAQLNRPLSIVHAYQEWTNLTPASQLRQVLADGSHTVDRLVVRRHRRQHRRRP